MSLLSRYKKKGFVQLLTLLETTPDEKRNRLLALIGEENPLWEEALRSRMLNLPLLLLWPERQWALILKDLKPLHVALLYHGLNPSEKTQLLELLSMDFRRKALLQLEEMSPPNEADIWSAKIKVFTEVRRLISDGSIRLNDIDPDLTIPDGIEEQLANGRILLLIKPEADAKPIESNRKNSPAENSNDHNAGLEELRKKFSLLFQENTRLLNENKNLKSDIEELKARISQIKKIA